MKKKDIDLVFKEKRIFNTGHFVLRWRPTTLPYPRVAFAFSRSAGGAVIRNRFKRWLREAVRQSASAGCVGIDLVFIPKRPLSRLTKHLWQQEQKLIFHFCEKNSQQTSGVPA